MKYRFSGKLTLLWLISLALILYSGIALVKKAKHEEEKSASVFANGGVYEGANIGFTDLMG